MDTIKNDSCMVAARMVGFKGLKQNARAMGGMQLVNQANILLRQ